MTDVRTASKTNEQTNREIIDELQKQLREYANRITTLESKLDQASAGVTENVIHEPCQSPYPPQPKVILFHDSMCGGKINDTICSRENIEVEKIWAPRINNVIEEIENLEETADVFAIHTMTNDLKDKNVDEMIGLISDVVDKSLNKCKKVIISTIINRDDDKELRVKA